MPHIPQSLQSPSPVRLYVSHSACKLPLALDVVRLESAIAGFLLQWSWSDFVLPQLCCACQRSCRCIGCCQTCVCQQAIGVHDLEWYHKCVNQCKLCRAHHRSCKTLLVGMLSDLCLPAGGLSIYPSTTSQSLQRDLLCQIA